MTKIAPALDLELIELEEAACTGAGVISERSPEIADTLNTRTFAMAENTGYPLMTICSTCQGVMSSVDAKFKKNPAYLEKINANLADQGYHYSGNLSTKHLLWIIVEDFGLDRLKALVRRPLAGLRVGPFYGCYIVRPTSRLGFKEHPDRATYLERIIEALGGEPVEYKGAQLCCGFPIVTMNQQNAVSMAGDHMVEAKGKGAECLVTPCPLCHLNLDGYQPDAARAKGATLDLPILHLPQLIGMALGYSAADLRMNRHIVSTKAIQERLGLATSVA
jgi:succinate dehydrogenase / fumarate reductase cytochrome b subunit